MTAPSIHTLSSTFGVVPLSVATCSEVQALSHRALRVYLVLLARHNAKRDGWAWSLTALANDTGIVRKKVPEAIQQIAQAGLVEIETGGGRASTHYRLLVPPSLRVVPMAGTSTPVQSPQRGLQQSPKRGLLNDEEGTPAVPTAGTPVVPTAGTTRQRSYTDETEEPPYPHSEQNRAEPKNPLAPCEQGEPIRSSVEGESQEYRLPEAMLRRTRAPRQAGLRERLRQDVVPDPPEVIPPDPVEYEGELTRGDLVRQVARDLGVRPREARRIVERREIISAQDVEPPPPLMVERQHIEEMRALGWLTPGMEEACAGRIIENGYTPVVA